MKAVMYHYVRDGVNQLPNYYYLDITDFRKQLDYFEDEFGFVDRESFLAYLRGESSDAPSGVILTFDDGLRDHYEFVYPELQKRNLWGIFYVPTAPYQTETLLDVHRTHVLLGKVSGSKLLAETREIIEDEMVPHRRREEYRTVTYKTQDDIEATKEVKRILNYYVADEYQTDVLDRLTARISHQPVDVSNYYVRPEELREMHKNGMTIGAHTVDHPVLSKLDKGEQEVQIHDSFSYLDNLLDNMNLKTFCYPYGNDASYNEITVELLNSYGCEWCFKVEQRDIMDADIKSCPQVLPRYDCNEFPYGEASGSIGMNQE